MSESRVCFFIKNKIDFIDIILGYFFIFINRIFRFGISDQVLVDITRIRVEEAITVAFSSAFG